MLTVKVRSNIRINRAGAATTISLTNANIIKRIENKVLRILKSEAPVKSGKFKRSIRKIESSSRQSEGIFRGFVKIGPTAVYSKYVIRKTRPSQGTYVPSLDRRIKFGQHPGTQANNFISRNIPRILGETQRIIDNHYGKGRFNIAQFIRR